MKGDSILVVRLGAMGDIIHALPAVASLRQSFPDKRIHWVVAGKWMPMLAGNPNVDSVIPFYRKTLAGLRNAWRALRPLKPAVAVDFQGLIQSALVGAVSRPREFVGLDAALARESLAARLYSKRVHAEGPHRVERNLLLAEAAGATKLCREAWIPPGKPEGQLPDGPFVLANPFAGWVSKQWPIENYDRLAVALQPLGLTLVLNIPPDRAPELAKFNSFHIHSSGLDGLIDATRRAVAVVGVDSGPLHLAAALDKPGVALYGPTDPAQTGPYQSRMTLLRSDNTTTTYKRGETIDPSMREISVEQVAQSLIYSISATFRTGGQA